MALNRYVLTATVTITPGTAATPTPGEPGTGGPAGYGSAARTGGGLYPVTFLAGTPIILDPAGSLYPALGAGNLRPYLEGTDDVGQAALAN